MLENFRIFLISLAEKGDIPSSFKYGFVINAMICALLIGPILGGIGTMVVTKKMAFFSEAVGHAAMTGIAIGVLLGEPFSAPYISLFTYCILFGSILTVSDIDIYILVVSAIIILFVLVPYLNKMLLASFNPSLAIVRGVNVKLIEYIFIIIVTIITIASVKIIGSILVEALLLIPAAAAKNLSKSIKGFVYYSIFFALVSCLLGVYLPIHFDISIPSGGAIILISSAIFVVTVVIKMIFKKFAEGE